MGAVLFGVITPQACSLHGPSQRRAEQNINREGCWYQRKWLRFSATNDGHRIWCMAMSENETMNIYFRLEKR